MTSPDAIEVPMTAVEAFEALTGLRLTVHDLRGSISAFLRPDRLLHTNSFCQAVKDSGYDPLCTDFDEIELHPAIGEEPAGLVKVCPAGLVEMVVPVVLEAKLAWVLFAGVRAAGDDLTAAKPSHQLPPGSIRWPAGKSLPPPIGEAEAMLCLEGLRQLAARLELWWQELGRPLERGEALGWRSTGDVVARRFVIRRFIAHRHQQRVGLRDLAAELGLSYSRTAHVVKETCASSFTELLTEARIRTAAGLLRHSGFSVLQVSLESGFADVSHFSRTFKARTSFTPRAYRDAFRHGSEEPSGDAA
jgi:AraC-like DNA-binding protein